MRREYTVYSAATEAVGIALTKFVEEETNVLQDEKAILASLRESEKENLPRGQAVIRMLHIVLDGLQYGSWPHTRPPKP